MRARGQVLPFAFRKRVTTCEISCPRSGSRDSRKSQSGGQLRFFHRRGRKGSAEERRGSRAGRYRVPLLRGPPRFLCGLCGKPFPNPRPSTAAGDERGITVRSVSPPCPPAPLPRLHAHGVGAAKKFSTRSQLWKISYIPRNTKPAPRSGMLTSVHIFE